MKLGTRFKIVKFVKRNCEAMVMSSEVFQLLIILLSF